MRPRPAAPAGRYAIDLPANRACFSYPRAVRLTSTLVVLCLLLGLAPRGEADIYAYVDQHGTTHYSNVPTDGRYLVILRAPPEAVADTAPPGAAKRADWHERAASYAGLIDRAARRHALQPALLRAIIAVESAFDPHAVSRAGAQGLMQLLPKTALRYGVGDAFDPEQNVRGGARYVADLLRRYGNNLELALAAYNAGEDAIERHGRQIPPFRETQAYVPAVLRLYREFLTRPS